MVDIRNIANDYIEEYRQRQDKAREYVDGLLPNLANLQGQDLGGMSTGTYPYVVMDSKWPLLYVKEEGEIFDVSPLFVLTDDLSCDDVDVIVTLPAPDPLELLRFMPVKEDAEIDVDTDIVKCEIEEEIVAIAQGMLDALIDNAHRHAKRNLTIHTYLLRNTIVGMNKALQSEYDGDPPRNVVDEAYGHLGLLLNKAYALAYKSAYEDEIDEIDEEIEAGEDLHESDGESQECDNQ